MPRTELAHRRGKGSVGVLQRRLLRWYRAHGRAALPWRTTRDPYRTVVSEFMLAQTQVDRVVPMFERFVATFPGFPELAQASPATVVRQWKGLGYNRRAVNLHRLAKAVVERHDGVLPTAAETLRVLPGVGPYTTAAIRAFAFNIDDAPVDTNVRRIVQRICFGIGQDADPAAIEHQASELVPTGRAHDWNSALMDLGATICAARAPRCEMCPVRLGCLAAGSCEIKRRSPQAALPFKNTSRYARGRIIDRLRDVPPGERISLLDLHGELASEIPQRSIEEVAAFVLNLEREGLVMCDGGGVALQE